MGLRGGAAATVTLQGRVQPHALQLLLLRGELRVRVGVRGSAMLLLRSVCGVLALSVSGVQVHVGGVPSALLCLVSLVLCLLLLVLLLHLVVAIGRVHVLLLLSLCRRAAQSRIRVRLPARARVHADSSGGHGANARSVSLLALLVQGYIGHGRRHAGPGEGGVGWHVPLLRVAAQARGTNLRTKKDKDSDE